MALGQNEVNLDDLIRRICYSSQESLEKLTTELANKNNSDRKLRLQAFLKSIRHRFIKLLVLIKWFVTDGHLVHECLQVCTDFANNEVRIFEAIAALRGSCAVLHIARAPRYDVPTAVDVLATGTYLRLPRKIAQVSGNLRLDDRLPEMDEQETLRKLEQYILDRLLFTKIPPQYSNFQVVNGCLICTVDHEFELTLTLSGASFESPWVVVKVEIFVAGDKHQTNENSVVDTSKTNTTKRKGVYAYLDSDMREEDDDDENHDGDTNDDGQEDDNKMEIEGKVLGSKKRKRKETTARDASTAYRPKKHAVFYLLKIVQQKLLKSTQPLIDAYEVLHTFCARLCVKMLEAQARELLENHWKAGALHVSSPRPNIVEMRHWQDTCLLRLSYDPTQREGQLFVELEPPIDTSACRSTISLALSKVPPSFRRKKLTLGATSTTTASNSTNAASERESELFVDGLCPSSLNVEKVLLLGALAHAEGRLNQLGSNLDHILFELETGNAPPNIRMEKPPWLPTFKHTISIVTNKTNVALHIDIPVQRYLRITVEMRTGDFILSLIRRVSGSGDIHHSSRKWGSSSDLNVLSTSEAMLNQAMKSKGSEEAAKVLLKLLFTLSMHAIMESLEIACESMQIATQRSSPFSLSPLPQEIQQSQQQQQQGQSNVIFKNVGSLEAFGAPPKQLTLAEEPNELDWFIVAGPFDRNVNTDRDKVLLGNTLPGISENFTSDATVKDTLHQALQVARQHALKVRVFRFKKHFVPAALVENQPSTGEIVLRITHSICGLVASAFDEPIVTITFDSQVLGFDVTIASSNPIPPTMNLPIGDFAELGLPFALTGNLSTSKTKQNIRVCLRFRAEAEDEFSDATSSVTSGVLPVNILQKPTTPGASLVVVKEALLVGFSDLASLNLDLIAAAKMEVLCQSLLSMRSNNSADRIEFNESCHVKIVYASHSCVILECTNNDTKLSAAVGIEPGLGRGFDIKILSIRKVSSKLVLPDELPWTSEIVKLLNCHIPSELQRVNWDFMGQVVRQLLASLTYGLPLLDTLHMLVSPQPDHVLNEHKTQEQKSPSTPIPAGGRAGGKFGLSMAIQARKASADKGARGIAILALSHLKLRALIGEFHQVDIVFQLDGIKIYGDNKYIGKYFESGSKLGYTQFPAKFQSCVTALLNL